MKTLIQRLAALALPIALFARRRGTVAAVLGPPMNVPKAPRAVLAATAAVIFAIDQVAKVIIRHELTPCSAPPVSLCDRVSIVGPLGLLRTDNGDAAFGLLAGKAIGPVLIALLGVVVWRLARLRWTPLLALAIGLQLGGLVANLADRALFGAVTDFIDLRVGVADKGVVLNPADVGLAVGGVLFAIVLSRGAKPRPMGQVEPHGEVGSARIGLMPDEFRSRPT